MREIPIYEHTYTRTRTHTRLSSSTRTRHRTQHVNRAMLSSCGHCLREQLHPKLDPQVQATRRTSIQIHSISNIGLATHTIMNEHRNEQPTTVRASGKKSKHTNLSNNKIVAPTAVHSLTSGRLGLLKKIVRVAILAIFATVSSLLRHWQPLAPKQWCLRTNESGSPFHIRS